MKKKLAEAFGKKIYLLGKFKDGKNFWLEEAKWDCGWYWGFGYIETYTNNANPGVSQDISSHQHYNGLCFIEPKFYDTAKECYRASANYVHILKDNPKVSDTVLSDAEQWELSDLMKTFYTLKSTAELFHSGNSRLASVSGLDLKDAEQEKHINAVLLPAVFKRIYEILTPKEGGK